MLHEARDRQKFVSDVQYLRDMQHKADSEYQVRRKLELSSPSTYSFMREFRVQYPCLISSNRFVKSKTHHVLDV